MSVFLVLMFSFFSCWVTYKYGLWIAAINWLSFLYGMYFWFAVKHQEGIEKTRWAKDMTEALKKMGEADKSDNPHERVM